MNHIEHIESKLADLRTNLNNHKLYEKLKTVDDIKIFMQHHVFAVWDFMSLLKALQRELTCTTVPWTPKSSPVVARFINEIVLGEETDENEHGEIKSHFEMYLEAMVELGATTNEIQNFVSNLNSVELVFERLEGLSIPESIKNFVRFTFEVIQTNQAHKIASAFTFGREDVIPDMFLEILKNADNSSSEKLIYYLKRHIELDGDEHGPLSLKMIAELCGDDQQKWNETLEVAIRAIEIRIKLWDGVCEAISRK